MVEFPRQSSTNRHSPKGRNHQNFNFWCLIVRNTKTEDLRHNDSVTGDYRCCGWHEFDARSAHLALMEGSPTGPTPTRTNFVRLGLRFLWNAALSNKTRQILLYTGCHSWLPQYDIDHGRRPDHSSTESTELRVLRRPFGSSNRNFQFCTERKHGATKRSALTQKGAPGHRPSYRRRGTR